MICFISTFTQVSKGGIMVKRPKIVDGKTGRIEVGCGSLYLTLNFVDGQPFELFLNGSKLGGCRANQESISRLATLLFKKDCPVEEIIDQLELIKCPACTRTKAKMVNQEDIKNFPTSCGDGVAKFLREYGKKEKETTSKTTT